MSSCYSTGVFSVYLITHIATTRHYVGVSRNVRRRWMRYLNDAKHDEPIKRRQHIVHAIREYGADAFVFQVIETYGTEAEALEAEAFWVEFLRSNVDGCGFNAAPGGGGGRTHTPEAREKMRQRKLGKKLTAEHRAKIGIASSRALMGHVVSTESRVKMRAAKLGKKQTQEHVANKAASTRANTLARRDAWLLVDEQ